MSILDSDSLVLFLMIVGFLQLALLLQLAPQVSRLFLNETHHGYGQVTRSSRVFLTPAGLVLGTCSWIGASLALVAGLHLIVSSLILFLISQYVFIRQRWVNLSRGCGAPGFTSYWLSVTAFILSVGEQIGPYALNAGISLATLDFALIFLTAGVYKFASGYTRGSGVYRGLVNPAWSYAPHFWSRRAKWRGLYKALDTYGWVGEIAGAILVLIPVTRSLGALIIASMFIALIPLIRLGTLTVVVLSMCLLVILGSSDPIAVLVKNAPQVPGVTISSAPMNATELVFVLVLVAVAGCLLLSNIGMVLNLYAGWKPPGLIQRTLDSLSSILGTSLWRVFTSDVTEFYVQIWDVSLVDHKEREISRWGGMGYSRFKDVTEAITVTSIFTARRYFPYDLSIFEGRLLRYAGSIPRACRRSRLEFRYIQIMADSDLVSYSNPVSFSIGQDSQSVVTHIHTSDTTTTPAQYSAVRPAIRPGTYRQHE